MTTTELEYILKRLAIAYQHGKLPAKDYARLHADYFYAWLAGKGVTIPK